MAMAKIITESGMDFIADNTFFIEKATLYLNLGSGVRSVEFVRLMGDKLLFIEARTTFPNPNNPSVENYAKFKSEIEEICEKFIHSLNLYSSVKTGVAEDALPDNFVSPDKVFLSFILVVKNHELKWCKPIREKLKMSLPVYVKKIWKPEVFVINQDTAVERNLVMS